MMRVDEIMISDVIKIGLDDTLEKIQELFEKHQFHHVLVVDGEELVGVISDRDVAKELSPYLNTLAEDARALKTLKKKAHQIMSRKPVSVVKTTVIEEAATLLVEKNISCLPVVSETGVVEGILTWKDILKYYVLKEIKSLETAE